jgi:DNA ligase (NAD+)
LDALLEAIQTVNRERAGLPFPTDGAVIKLDLTADQRAVGASDAAPRGALAYKFAPERVETKVLAITLQVGRTGVLTPVAELEPVQIAGSKVARATLHNREEIARKDVRIGDYIFLEKAGDVIPAVVGVNLERRSSAAEPFHFPIACPSCYTALDKSETEVAVRCPNHECPAQVRRRVEHFASKGCLDIDTLGPAMVEVLVGNGWVKDLPDLYRLNRADLLSLGRNNDKSVSRLIAAIEKSKGAELWRVIYGLGLPQVGASTAKDLARQCGSLAALAEHGPAAAAVLAESRYQNLIAELIAVGVAPAAPARETKPEAMRAFDASPGKRADPVSGGELGRFAGKTFILTGTLPTLSRAQAAEKIERAGGKITSTVSRNTNYAVVGREPGTKLTQARKLGIPILNEAALLNMLESGKVPDDVQPDE